MTVRVSVNLDLCESHGVCVRVAPDIFAIDDDEVTRVLVPEPGPARYEAVRAAARQCPKQAIDVTE